MKDLLIILLIAAVVGMYFYSKQIQDHLTAAQDQNTQLQQQVAALQARAQATPRPATAPRIFFSDPFTSGDPNANPLDQSVQGGRGGR